MTAEHPPLAWLVLLPLCGTLVNGLLGSRLPRRWVGVVGVAAVLASFGLALRATLLLAETPSLVLTTTLYTWLSAGDLEVPVRFVFDSLSSVLVLVVTGVGSLIHLYSVGYMARDPGYARYFAYLNLFTFSMLVLVLASSLPLLFVGWEGVGLCSYLLIGFAYSDRAKAAAGMKAFVVNRIGDVGLLLGMLVLYRVFGTLELADLQWAPLKPAARAGYVTVIGLLLFLGAVGKSAQLPLHVWLPDAMAGPTPVSALIHAATMVTAGVYLVCRMHYLYIQTPVAMAVIATVGAVTALVAATVALTQRDIKGVLAWSTVSQLGYMFLAAGVGAFSVAIFHLVTHAFFKAALFLGAGSVIHALAHAQTDAGVEGDPQDVRRMGGLWSPLRLTALPFLAGGLALAGFPLTAGFLSKDEVLWSALTVFPMKASGWLPQVPPVLCAVGVVAALLTALYAGRLLLLIFSGRCRAGDEVCRHVHESPASMTAPLVVLGLLSLGGGVLGLPHLLADPTGLPLELLRDWINWEVGESQARVSVRAMPLPWHGAWMAGTGALSLLGLGLAVVLWGRGRSRLPARIAGALGAAHRLVADGYRLDALYDRLVVRPLLAVSDRLLRRVVDEGLIDTVLVGLPGLVARSTGRLLRQGQTGNAQWYATVLLLGVALLLAYCL